MPFTVIQKSAVRRGAFTPLVAPFGWWRGDDIVPNAGTVDLIPDRGGNATLDLVQATVGLRPTYSASLKNGEPGWIVDNVDDIIASGSVAGVAAPYTFLFAALYVAADLPPAGNNRSVSNSPSGTPNVRITTVPNILCRATASGASVSLTGDVWNVWAFSFNGTSDTAIIQNGTITTAATGGVVASLTGMEMLSVLMVGYSMVELMVLPVRHDDPAINHAGAYMASRYSIPGTW